MYSRASDFLEPARLKVMGEFFAFGVIFEIIYAARVNFSFHAHVLSARNMEIARIKADTNIPIINGMKKTTPILNP